MRCIVVGVDGIHTVVMLLTFILIIIISIPPPPLFHSRLKPSFSANLSISVLFYFLVFLFYTFSLSVACGRLS